MSDDAACCRCSTTANRWARNLLLSSALYAASAGQLWPAGALTLALERERDSSGAEARVLADALAATPGTTSAPEAVG